jgi:N-carbamoyl-L-amino-acid hydrolase
MRSTSLTRRTFLAALASLPALVAADWHDAIAQDAVTPPIDARRLRERLEALSVFGRPPGGSFADGVSRVAYSDADLQARQYVMGLLKDAGLAPRIDAAGNIVARRGGADAALPPLVIGSHVDSVPNGGNFDGALGTLAAAEVMQTLETRRLVTRHPVELVVWTNEEGVAFGNGLCGSRAAAGELEPGELDRVWNGLAFRDAVRKIGGDPARIAEARRAPGSIHAYLELHIEQGGVLDRAGIPIGVVEGIVAIERHEAVVHGVPNHAGTTPMPDRRDALVAASELVLAVRQVVAAEPGRQVGTVGQLVVTPNAPNVVPGVVRLTIELRDLDETKIARLREAIRRRAGEIATQTGTAIDISPTSFHRAAPADPRVQEAIEEAARRLNLPTRRLPSGAGHDAQMMARIGPMGMIFVPSVGGVSHSPRETTRWADCANGAAVLLDSVLAVDRKTMPS